MTYYEEKEQSTRELIACEWWLIKVCWLIAPVVWIISEIAR